jgi:hypothetical protein
MEQEVLHMLPLCLPPAELEDLRFAIYRKVLSAVRGASVRDVVTLCSLPFKALDGRRPYKSMTILMEAIVLAGNSRSTPATHKTYQTIIRVLVAAGADVHIRDTSCYRLNDMDYAAEQELESVCRVLEAAGARSTLMGQLRFGVRPAAPLTRARTAAALLERDPREPGWAVYNPLLEPPEWRRV